MNQTNYSTAFRKKKYQSYDQKSILEMQLYHNKTQQEQINIAEDEKFYQELGDYDFKSSAVNDRMKKMQSQKIYPSRKLMNYINNQNNIQKDMNFEDYLKKYQNTQKIEMVKYNEQVFIKNKLKGNPEESKKFIQQLKQIKEEEQSFKRFLMKNNTEEKKPKNNQIHKPQIFKLHWYNNGDKISDVVKKKQRIGAIKEQLQIQNKINMQGSAGSALNQTQDSIASQMQQESNWNPPMKQGCATAIILNKIHMYGGFGIEDKQLNMLYSFNLDTQQWEKTKLHGDVPHMPITGHGFGIYKDKIIMFGGLVYYQEKRKIDECLSEIRIIDPKNKKIELIHSQNYFIPGRKYHGQCVIGETLWVCGGQSSNGQFLSDFYKFEFEKLNWKKVDVVPQSKKVSRILKHGLAHHKALYIDKEIMGALNINKHVKQNIKGIQNNLYKTQAEKQDQKTKIPGVSGFISRMSKFNLVQNSPDIHIKYVDQQELEPYEGMYIFGGINKKGQINGDMLFLPKNQENLYILETIGDPPSPRYGHSMIFDNELGLIIIYGGRNEDDRFLHEVNILQVEGNEWVKLELVGNDFGLNMNHICRADHGAFMYEESMYVLGGYNQNGFIQNKIIQLETNQEVCGVIDAHFKQGGGRVPEEEGDTYRTQNTQHSDNDIYVFDHEFNELVKKPQITPQKILDKDKSRQSIDNSLHRKRSKKFSKKYKSLKQLEPMEYS